MEKVVTVVVTYNRKEKLEKNIKCLLNQTYLINDIFIIDNASTDGTDLLVKNIISNNNSSTKISYYKLDNNTGGSGGFSYGVSLASKSDNRYIWGMDDDAFPEKNALEELMKFASVKHCLWSNCNGDTDFESEKKEVNKWMFVGFFIPKNIVKDVGLPRSDFFIYHDDHEYAHRIIKKGYKIYKIRDSIISHNDGPSSNIIRGKFLWKRPYMALLPDWKYYYYIRNSILMYKWTEKEKWYNIFYDCPRKFAQGLILKTKQSKIFLKAYLDGIFCRTGKIVDPSYKRKK